MPLRTETEEYLAAVERHDAKKLRYRTEIGAIIDLADGSSLWEEFERIVFLAKFVTNAFNILRRGGLRAEETAPLTRELEVNLSDVTDRLRRLAGRSSDRDFSAGFEKEFLALSHASVESLQGLLSELARIKNRMLDGEFPPIRGSVPS